MAWKQRFNSWNFGERVAAEICGRTSLERPTNPQLYVDAIYFQQRFLYVFARMFPRAAMKDLNPKDFDQRDVHRCFDLCVLCDMLLPSPETNERQ